MQEWVPKYGKVITFWFGPIPTVNICDHQLAVDAMVKKGSNFADKISLYIARVIRNGRGVIFSNGPEWLEQRRFALHTLRNFGLGRNLIEERIMYEFNICCDELDRRLNAGEKSIEPHTSFDLLVGNIINRMLFTERFGKNEAESFFALKKEMDDVMEHFTHLDLLIEESIVEWPLIKQRVNQVMEPIKAVLAFVGNQVDQRKRAISDGSHVLHGEGDDFVDAFLIQMAKEKTSGKPHSFETCDSRGAGGFGVLVNTNLAMNIDSFEQRTTRIGRLRLMRRGSMPALTVFVVYAPTSDYDNEEVEAFHYTWS
ncbi:unnamed protein product [Nippostrongylus brasiliensis]|uniref:Cytochrome P450 n=1 Tax=Nippostrongylus brasiliensis TaxID=27835 RepID=A0A0N4YH79_NIPBR|nr:unnamed protein product [Nippostrongylus brasiliensis]